MKYTTIKKEVIAFPDPKNDNFMIVTITDAFTGNSGRSLPHSFLLNKSEFNMLFRSSETYIERIHNELFDLKASIEELKAFLCSRKFKTLSDGQKELLEKQLEAMQIYKEILQNRYANEQTSM